MTDSPVQFTPAVGYLRRYPSMTCAQFDQAAEQLAVFAGRRGFVLRKVFVEQLATDPVAFDALVRMVKRREIPAVLVLTQAHLSAVGGGETKSRRLERETGARALTASGPSS
ncbi:hypothetical protein OG474_04340 [Kribbella sp. NBC_01505]|uniref:hypothetical protein n=1 Tax=Kribbella sp. NBC_01505 TaxID=2903580 RepID=UPI003865BC41